MKSLAWWASAAAVLVSTAGLAQPNNPVVFDDSFSSGVSYQPFLYSDPDAISIDRSRSIEGTSSLRITVSPAGGSFAFSGGAFVANNGRDLTGYEALTFWALASQVSSLDLAGFGVDSGGPSAYQAQRELIPITTAWSKIIIPIPLAAKLGDETGLFFFAEGPDGVDGNTLWLDDIRFETLGNIASIQPSMWTGTREGFVGQTKTAEQTRVLFGVGAANYMVDHGPAYFTYFTSNPGVVGINGELLELVGPGTATISASLGATSVSGALSLVGNAIPPVPAPVPTFAADRVICLFSESYVEVPVSSWSADWDQAELTELDISGNAAKAYLNRGFAGIEFSTPTIDASAMSHFYMNLWASSGAELRLMLVDWGPDNLYGGGDDSQHELIFDGNSDPPVTTGGWMTLQIPLADFSQLASVEHLAQLVIAGSVNPFFIDNVMFVQQAVTAVEYSAGPRRPEILSVTPNPFNPRTTISFAVPAPGSATLRIVDVAGRLVRRMRLLVDAPGEFDVEWDGTDRFGKSVAGGVYFLELMTGQGRDVTRVTLLK